MRLSLLIFTSLFILSIQAQKIYKQSTQLMGCGFEITVVAASEAESDRFIDMAIAEMQRVEKLISSWDSSSQTSLINRNAGIQVVVVDAELIGLIKRSIALSKLTDGAFDISYASMDRIWRFDGSMKEMPDLVRIKSSVEKVGFENIIVDEENSTVFLKEKGMKIGFGGIGKGYAADKAKELLLNNGIESGIINAAGDMNCWGTQPGGKAWEVAITNPLDKSKTFGILPIHGRAVVTSGDYEKYVEFNGKRYAHIINPKTGYPATGIISVTVFAPKAELADALATSIFVMGIETGLDRVNQLPNIEAIIIDENGAIFESKHIEINH